MPLHLLPFTDAVTPREPLYINPDHVCLVRGSGQRTIVHLNGGFHLEVAEGVNEVVRKLEARQAGDDKRLLERNISATVT